MQAMRPRPAWSWSGSQIPIFGIVIKSTGMFAIGVSTGLYKKIDRESSRSTIMRDAMKWQ